MPILEWILAIGGFIFMILIFMGWGLDSTSGPQHDWTDEDYDPDED